jgi:hypothetical protein
MITSSFSLPVEFDEVYDEGIISADSGTCTRTVPFYQGGSTRVSTASITTEITQEHASDAKEDTIGHGGKRRVRCIPESSLWQRCRGHVLGIDVA